MRSHEMLNVEPVFLGNEPHQILLNLDGIGIGSPAQASREPSDVGIDNEALNDAKSVAQHHVSRLPGHSRQRQQLLHRQWHCAAVLRNEALAGSADIFGFVAIEARWPYILLKLFLADRSVVFYFTILLK